LAYWFGDRLPARVPPGELNVHWSRNRHRPTSEHFRDRCSFGKWRPCVLLRSGPSNHSHSFSQAIASYRFAFPQVDCRNSDVVAVKRCHSPLERARTRTSVADSGRRRPRVGTTHRGM